MRRRVITRTKEDGRQHQRPAESQTGIARPLHGRAGDTGKARRPDGDRPQNDEGKPGQPLVTAHRAQFGAVLGDLRIIGQIGPRHAGTGSLFGSFLIFLPAEPSYSLGSVRVSAPPSGSELARPTREPGFGVLPAAKSSMI